MADPAVAERGRAAPRISVCIPTYQYARYVGRAIESVLTQTYEDLELIVLDDASTDDTADVLDMFRDPRLVAMVNPENLGLFQNFNRAIELSSGEFVKFLCADDWLDPRYLENALTVLDGNAGVDLLTTPGWLVDESDRIFAFKGTGFGERDVIPRREAIRSLAEDYNVVGMPTNVMVRRQALLDVGGFDCTIGAAADLHLWVKLLGGTDLGYVRQPRCFMRVHAVKSHRYGADPTESPFVCWKELAARPRSGVDDAVLDAALQASAEQSYYVAAGHVAGLRWHRAAHVLRFTFRHVAPLRSLWRMARRLPRTMPPHAARIVARRSGRLIVYDPRPRIGQRLRPPGHLSAGR